MALPLLRTGLLRLPSLAAHRVRGIVSKPARDPTGPMESAIALSTFFVTILVPAGYILANLENYKNRE